MAKVHVKKPNLKQLDKYGFGQVKPGIWVLEEEEVEIEIWTVGRLWIVRAESSCRGDRRIYREMFTYLDDLIYWLKASWLLSDDGEDE